MNGIVLFCEKHPGLAIVIKFIFKIIFFLISLFNEICGLFRVLGFPSKCKSLLEYKNKYKGERCFVVCTGPSLTNEDLELIKDEYTFGMNSIVKKYGEFEFRPTFYGIQDYMVYGALEEEITNSYKDKKNVFVADRVCFHYKVDPAWNIFPLNVSYHAYKKWFKNEFCGKISSNIYRLVYCNFSITHSLIQIAMYMGFDEIYLIGADCSFSTKKPLHFAEHGVVDLTLDTARERNIVGYEAIKKYADRKGIRVCNATRGGELEVFSRVELESVLK